MKTESLFYEGGTIDKVYHHKLGFFSINNKYLFLSNNKDRIQKAVKIEIDKNFTFKLLKTKIKINNKEKFIEFMLDDFWSDVNKKIFNFYLKN